MGHLWLLELHITQGAPNRSGFNKMNGKIVYGSCNIVYIYIYIYIHYNMYIYNNICITVIHYYYYTFLCYVMSCYIILYL